MFSHSDKIPISRALLWVFLSIFFVSGIAFLAWLYYLHLQVVCFNDQQYNIVAIIQTSPQKEALKTVYLAEWLNLSLDKPANLYQYNTHEAEQRLLASPLIKKAAVKKIRPGTLYIDYQVRVPIAYLGDYTNTALDADGYLFPFSPFFTPKKLPIFYLGLDRVAKGWGASLIEDERLQLAFELLNHAQEKGLNVKQIDVSKAFADSYGQRQIVIFVDEKWEKKHRGKTVAVNESYILRLNTEDFLQSLANYLVLRKTLLNRDEEASTAITGSNILSPLREVNPSIIDLRIPHLAFIKKEL